LGATKISGDFCFERGVDRLGEIVPEQHIFGRYGRIRFELEKKMAVLTLVREQSFGGAIDMAIEIEVAHCGIIG
jgi:hypothetical protein